ncbi:MAG: glycoside hydrolase family 32 protein [Bacteroidetes bacterium]|nr:glycoside hydrolase family 32 protein [Bacteroidota bacterium]
MKYLIIFCMLINVMASQAQDNPLSEKYRPQFHFTPAINWTNDPNGLVYYNGKYHLFYQYNPLGNIWGHMSWGHATSIDLIHWKHLPVAIPEEKGTMIFSGAAVMDEHNTSGFAQKKGTVPMVAIYTGNFVADTSNRDNYLQSQNVAYSLDDGTSWIKYKKNPVLDLHKKDFRDPSVFWYAPQKKWIMAVVLPHEHIVQFYGSSNLTSWNHLSDFGPAGDTNDIWECPNLVQVPVAGSTSKKKWVLFNSQQDRMQYFVGEFDGTKFINENPASEIYRPDYGPDYYAGITYNNLPSNQPPVLLAWVNNWTYANDIPTRPWKGMMSLPRQLSLKKINNAWTLIQKPVPAIYKLRGELWEDTKVKVDKENKLPVYSQQCEIEINWQPVANTISGIYIAAGKNNKLVIGYDAKEQKLFMDRTNAGDISFNKKFGELSKYETKISLKENELRLHIFFDQSVVEVFANGGERVMTMQLFPEEAYQEITLYSEQGSNTFQDVKVWKMGSIWKGEK